MQHSEEWYLLLHCFPCLSCVLQDKWLLHSVLLLVQSWIKPLVYLQTTMNRYDLASDMLLNKTKWLFEKLISLEHGVVVLIKKVGHKFNIHGKIATVSCKCFDRQHASFHVNQLADNSMPFSSFCFKCYCADGKWSSDDYNSQRTRHVPDQSAARHSGVCHERLQLTQLLQEGRSQNGAFA